MMVVVPWPAWLGFGVWQVYLACGQDEDDRGERGRVLEGGREVEGRHVDVMLANVLEDEERQC